MRDFLLHGTPFQHIRSIKQEVATEYGVSVDEICSLSRVARIVKARHEAFLRVRERTSLSFPRIAKHFNRKDHTTILYGCDMAKKRRAANVT